MAVTLKDEVANAGADWKAVHAQFSRRKGMPHMAFAVRPQGNLRLILTFDCDTDEIQPAIEEARAKVKAVSDDFDANHLSMQSLRGLVEVRDKCRARIAAAKQKAETLRDEIRATALRGDDPEKLVKQLGQAESEASLQEELLPRMEQDVAKARTEATRIKRELMRVTKQRVLSEANAEIEEAMAFVGVHANYSFNQLAAAAAVRDAFANNHMARESSIPE